MNIKVLSNFNTVRILIDDVLHMHFKRDLWVGTQALYHGDDKYCIEYYLVGQTILCEYDSVEKWRCILEQINEHKF